MNKIIFSLLLLLILNGCVTPRVSDVTWMTALENRSILEASNQGFDYCANNGDYYYGVDDVKDSVNHLAGEVQTVCFPNWQEANKFDEWRNDTPYAEGINIKNNYSTYNATSGSKKTRLAIEVDEKVKKLDLEFMCIELMGESLLYSISKDYQDHAMFREIQSRTNSEDITACTPIHNDYIFAKQVDASQQKCMQMGFSLETPDMSKCTLELIAADMSKSEAKTIVVDGSSSDSAIADELKKMNRRENQKYYEKMMRTGYDMMTCYTWPNC